MAVSAEDPLWQKAATYLAGLCVALLGGLWKWALGRLDGKADKTSIDKIERLIESQAVEARESRRALYAKVDSVNEKLDDTITNWNATAVRVGRLEGKLEKD